MYYKKIDLENDTIEFFNNWLGKETVKVNGHTVSEKSSLMGTDHHFTITEGGESAYYTLTSKVYDSMQVGLDIRRNGQVFMDDVLVPMKFAPKSVKNPMKKSGITKIRQYDIAEGIDDLQASLKVDANDPEVYFYMACGYSIQENIAEGFECLEQAVVHNLQDTDSIMEHGMLAYLRTQNQFESFATSNFTEYQLEEE